MSRPTYHPPGRTELTIVCFAIIFSPNPFTPATPPLLSKLLPPPPHQLPSTPSHTRATSEAACVVGGVVLVVVVRHDRPTYIPTHTTTTTAAATRHRTIGTAPCVQLTRRAQASVCKNPIESQHFAKAGRRADERLSRRTCTIAKSKKKNINIYILANDKYNKRTILTKKLRRGLSRRRTFMCMQVSDI